jgi:hypothetical protein
MQIHLKVIGRDLAPSLKLLVEQHFRFLVHPHQSAIESVEVLLSDDSEADLGKGKGCRAVVTLRNGRSLTVERRDSRIESAVHRVARRIFHSLRTRNAKSGSEPAECAA